MLVSMYFLSIYVWYTLILCTDVFVSSSLTLSCFANFTVNLIVLNIQKKTQIRLLTSQSLCVWGEGCWCWCWCWQWLFRNVVSCFLRFLDSGPLSTFLSGPTLPISAVPLLLSLTAVLVVSPQCSLCPRIEPQRACLEGSQGLDFSSPRKVLEVVLPCTHQILECAKPFQFQLLSPSVFMWGMRKVQQLL